MYSVEELLFQIKTYQQSCVGLKKCAFYKLPLSNQFGDLVSGCCTTFGQKILVMELQHLIEESQRNPKKIKVASFSINKNNIYLKLDRLSTIKLVFMDIFEYKTDYGCSNKFINKAFRICYGESRNEMTALRMKTAGDMVAALITLGGGSVTDSTDAQPVHVSPRPGSSILVGSVHIAGSADTSQANYLELRRAELQHSDHKELSEQSRDQLVNATVVFDLLSVKLSKALVLNSSSVPLSARRSNCKGATFVLYNYARLCTILDRFEHTVSKGVYKLLPPFHDLDYHLLVKEEEWRLVYFLAEWPAVVAECQDVNQPKLHNIVAYISALASNFSVFYKYNRVLNEGLPHMLPLMEARIHLLKALKEVFLIAFSVLGINAPTKM